MSFRAKTVQSESFSMFALCCVQKPVPGQISEVIKTPPIQSLLYKPFNDTLDKLELSQEEKSVRTLHTADTMGWAPLLPNKTH